MASKIYPAIFYTIAVFGEGEEEQDELVVVGCSDGDEPPDDVTSNLYVSVVALLNILRLIARQKHCPGARRSVSD